MKNGLQAFLLFLFISCQAQPKANTAITAEEFEKEMTGTGVQILDVRTSEEYKDGHIKNALLADWTNKDQFYERVKYVDKDKPVYIYCLSGGRSAAAAKWLRNNGYTNVVELQGGINAWKNADKPLEGSNNEVQLTMNEYLASIPSNKTTLVDFGAEWCPPCVKMQPVLDELQNDNKINFHFMKIDAGIHTNLMKDLHIEPIPLFIIYKNGKEVWRKEGIVTKEEFIKQLQ